MQRLRNLKASTAGAVSFLGAGTVGYVQRLIRMRVRHPHEMCDFVEEDAAHGFRIVRIELKHCMKIATKETFRKLEMERAYPSQHNGLAAAHA